MTREQDEFANKLYEKYQEFEDKEHFVNLTRRLYPDLVDAAVRGDRSAIDEIRHRIGNEAKYYNNNTEDDRENIITLGLIDIYWFEQLKEDEIDEIEKERKKLKKGAIIGFVIGFLFSLVAWSELGPFGMLYAPFFALIGGAFSSLVNFSRSVSNNFSDSSTRSGVFFIIILFGASIAPFITIYRFFKLYVFEK